MVPVAALVEDYSLCASTEDLAALELSSYPPPGDQPDLLCLAILTVSEERSLTANLLAPVVINLAANLAVQAVRADSAYSHRFAVTSLRPTPGPGQGPSPAPGQGRLSC
jgi:flagellar assembly factor FliW